MTTDAIRSQPFFGEGFLKPKPPIAKRTLPMAPAAWGESAIYGYSDFPRYNPDDLIGRKGYKIYQQMMVDEQVKAVVRFRRDAVSGREWSFVMPEDTKLSDEEQARRIAISNSIIKQMRGAFKDKLNAILSALHQGFSITEVVYKFVQYDKKNYWGIKDMTKKPFETFLFQEDEYGELLRTIQQVSGREQTIDMNTVVHHVQNPDEDPHYGRSELREAYRAYYSKDMVIKFGNMHLQRHASGFVWMEETEDGTAPKEGTREHTSLLNILNNFQVKTGILMPHGMQMHLEKPNNTDAFEKWIGMHDKGIAKALLMPNLMGFSEDGSVGSQARAQTQLEAFLWILDAEAESAEETLNEQVFRRLGEANFGDDDYPRFKFRPLSKAMMKLIVDTWAGLVDKNAVVPSLEDENHVRNLMDFPAKPEPEENEENPEAVDSETALEGPQITAMMEVVEKVATGSIPWETGVSILVRSFPLSQEQAEALLKDIPKDKYDPNAEPAQQPGEEEDPAKPATPTATPTSTEDEEDDEELIPAKAVKIVQSKFTRQLRRVNFSEIDRSSSVVIAEGLDRTLVHMDNLARYYVKDIQDKSIDDKPEAIEDLQPPSSIVSKLRETARESMSAGWQLGVVQGRREVEKAGSEIAQQMKKVEFAKFVALSDAAAAYFDSRSFQMAGNLSKQAQGIVENSLFNSVKYSWSTDDTIEDIYVNLAKAGVISEELATEQLGDKLGTINPFSRVETTVRTTTFEAINEARFNYFTDEALDGFVEALEYSAILDTRTTEICTDLDGRVYQAGSSEWDKYRPPNHFNCRSLLIPVVEGDEFVETTRPHAAQPQAGFG